MSRAAAWVRPDVRAMSSYHVAPSAGLVKLDAMENPYRLPEVLREGLAAALAEVAINRYPDPAAAELKAQLRLSFGVPKEAALVLGNGSDEIIQFAALALAQPGATLLAPEPSFVLYRSCALFAGMRYHGVPLREDFSLDLPATLAAIERERPALVFLAFPNNPTGNLFPTESVRVIIEAAPGLVIIDEAYHAYSGASFLPHLNHYDNVVVMRTVSKLGLAGLRLGFAACAPAWIDEFEKLRPPYNVNSLTQAAAAVLLRQQDVFLEQTRAVLAEREPLAAALSALPRIEVFPSAANFLLIRVPAAQSVYQGLRANGVLVKAFGGAHPLLRDCLRVTVGTPAENSALLAALRLVLDLK